MEQNTREKPWSICIYQQALPMAPSILEMAKEDTPIIGIKSTLAISLPLPKICKPAVTAMKIVPALDWGSGVSQ